MPKPSTSGAHPVAFFLLFFFFPLLIFRAESQQLEAREQSVLLRLRQYWGNPPSLDHWVSSNSSTSHCSWPEINCTDGSVAKLLLTNTGISGPVPSFLCDLGNLTTLDLSYNNIPGGFPTVLYNCSKLDYLDISQNYFVGPVPSDIDRLANLQFLNIGANNFTFDIPPAIGRLTQLRSLYIYQNQFNGTYPEELANLSNLEVLGMAYNMKLVPSTFPVNFTTGLKKLTYLWMTSMNLIGGIPDAIGNMQALEFLDLSVNELTGKIPGSIFTLKNLSILYIQTTNLSGEIPQTIESLKLTVIDLSANNLTGNIPDGFGNLEKLQSLVLMYNQLSGHIPESLGRLPALTDVRLFSNYLSGTLPPDFGRYSPLSGFEVDSNRFTGPLPENLCFGGKLRGVVAHDNNLTSGLPQSLGSCDSLVIVSVSNNRLSGKIPEGLWTSMNLSTIQLSNNEFSGELPDKISGNLSRVEISNNQFSGNIPAWRNVVVFEASNNLFSGSIPVELTDLPILTTLSLDRNNLTGIIPDNIISWKSLVMLNLSHNKLSGPIPDKIGSLPALSSLDLSQNQISGNIPSQLGVMQPTFLNLSSNRLTGKIPTELENSAYSSSFLDNPGLCSSNPSEFKLKACSSSSGGSNKLSSRSIIFIVFAAVAASLTILIICAYILKVYRDKRREADSTWKITPFHRLEFNESNILSGLTEQNVIGSGGSGKVYQIPINHSSGTFVAVKRIFNSRKLDNSLEKEFLAEVQILGKIRHMNIVKLLCCISSENSKLLVYEYMENRSLDQWLHRKKAITGYNNGKDALLDWPKRLKIAIGAAQGLCYMHHDCTPPIIHRDVKSSNILLDSEFNAKIADFGLARMSMKSGEVNTLSGVAGTFGYIAPEYGQTTRVNTKIDVYSFGVILLELITGREANDGDEDLPLAEWAWRHIQDNKPISDALDNEIKEPHYVDEISSVFKLGIICTSSLPSSRPSMKEVLQVLQRCASPLVVRVEKNAGDEYDVAPLLRNSKREQALEDDDHSL